MDVARPAGTFKLTLQFTEDYPNKAPVVRFESKMFHPNSARAASPAHSALVTLCVERRIWRSPHPLPAVYADGGICLDILQNQWSPIYDVSAILTSIQVRLRIPLGIPAQRAAC